MPVSVTGVLDLRWRTMADVFDRSSSEQLCMHILKYPVLMSVTLRLGA